MTTDQAITTFILMLVAQIPILVAAIAGWLRSKENGQKTDAVSSKADVISDKADAAALKAGVASLVSISTANKMDAVSKQLDDNTAMTASVANAINGHDGTPNRLEEIHTYTHQTKHELANAVNNLAIKIEMLLVLTKRQLAVREPDAELLPKKGVQT